MKNGLNYDCVNMSPCYETATDPGGIPAPPPPPPPERNGTFFLYMCIYFYSGTLKFSSRADAFGNPQSQVQGFIVRILVIIQLYVPPPLPTNFG